MGHRAVASFSPAVEDWRYQELYEVEDHHWWFRSRRRVVASLLGNVRLPAQPRILDAGCGTGRNLVELARLGEAEGVDASAEAVDFCRRRGLPWVQQAALESLPYSEGRFDLISSTDVIEHLADPVPALAELRRVAAPGATLLLTVPAYQWLWSELDVSMHHHRRYSVSGLSEHVEAAGWQPVRSTHFLTVLLPAAIIVRLADKLFSRGSSRSQLSPAPEWLNRLLLLPCRLETAVIGRGSRLPAGLSIGMLCAAR